MGKFFIAFGLVLVAVGSVVPITKMVDRKEKSNLRPDLEQGQENIPHVKVQKPLRKTIYRTLTVPGDIVPNREVTITSRITGYLERFGKDEKKHSMDRGSEIKEGDFLVAISVPELEKQLEREEAELSLCGPTIERQMAEVEWRLSQYKRARELVEKSPNLISKDSVDELSGKYQIALAELEVAKARVAIFQAAVDKTEELLKFARIKAPFSGIITERWVEEGDLVQSGSTKIFHIVEMNPVRIRVYIPDTEVPHISSKTKARVILSDLADKKWEASVSRFSWVLNRNTKTMMAEIDVKNDKYEIRPGMFAQVNLYLDLRENTLTIQASALVVEKKEHFVYVIKNGIAEKVRVEIGLDNGLEVEILKGLTEENEVVVKGQVTHGTKVLVTR